MKLSKFRRGYIMEVVLKKIRLFSDKKARIMTDKQGRMTIKYSVYCKHTKRRTLRYMDEAGAHHLFMELYGGK